MNLGEIIQSAMDKVNEQTNPSSGKWSLAWWTRQVNRAKDVLAQKTGYRLKRHILAVTEGTQFTALPSTLCWGIVNVKLGTTQLDGYDTMSMDNEYPGWRYQSEFPNQPQNDNVEIVSSEAADTTQTITIHGTQYSNGAYVTEEVELNGTTQVSPSTVTAWDEIYYVELDAVCAGTVTVREASANATITTIAAGGLSSGTDISMAKPTIYVIAPPNIEWYQVPDADYTAYLLGGELPADFTTASSTSDSQAATGLPAQYHYLLAEGAATLALLGDLSADSQDVRMSITGKAFYNGIDDLNAYLASISRERTGAMPLEASLGYEHFDVR